LGVAFNHLLAELANLLGDALIKARQIFGQASLELLFDKYDRFLPRVGQKLVEEINQRLRDVVPERVSEKARYDNCRHGDSPRL